MQQKKSPIILSAATIGLLAVVVMALQYLGAKPWLQYEDSWWGMQEYWRLWTGHWVHMSWSHAGMNIASIVVLQWIFWRVWRMVDWLVLFLLGAVWISLLFTWLQPQLQWYVGLSGLVHGLWWLGAWRLLKHDRLIAGLLLLLLVAKLSYEQSTGSMPWSAEMAQGNVIVAAHLYGAIFGFLYGLLNIKQIFKKES